MSVNAANHELFLDRTVLISLLPLIQPWLAELLALDTETHQDTNMQDKTQLKSSVMIRGRSTFRSVTDMSESDRGRAVTAMRRHEWSTNEHDTLMNMLV